jgi:hypothetical protein
LSFRDIEDLLAERGDIWHLDEVFVNIQGKRSDSSLYTGSSATCSGWGGI